MAQEKALARAKDRARALEMVLVKDQVRDQAKALVMGLV